VLLLSVFANLISFVWPVHAKSTCGAFWPVSLAKYFNVDFGVVRH
jgi:hypothetical protein